MPDFAPWLLFFLRALQKQKQHLFEKIELEKRVYFQLTPLCNKILSLINQHGRLKISELEGMTNANRNTLKKSVAYLVNNNYLIQRGKGRATWYEVSSEI